ncbi:uncharacterized protein I303_101209 [Kwoniella dejecticola CBS 10117]|uniref:Elongation factor Ts, mitochondrial n=1 Tax=Kwoniella dejecticola CBS 10117 TaxID=1296121 RepID=A0A1A6AH97_9TREE|nr:elongation factor Ts, mitochondrial [Kwoniella dejecticola CBS 10117]OBR89388.1 elongation factor Ts, mitochondrial [Kwoniella dejecticola CBS 10117]
MSGSLLPRASSSLRSTFFPTIRSFSSTSLRLDDQKPKSKVPISLIASLRKEFPVPLAQAREALEKSNLDLKGALDYLRTSTSANAEKKAAKVSGRTTNEGVISISLLSNKRVGMVHLGCETDFVAKNNIFLNTAKNISETTAFLDVPPEETEHPSQHQSQQNNGEIKVGQDPILQFPVESLLSAPLISLPTPNEGNSDSHSAVITQSSEPQTIKQTLLSSLSQTGENLKLIRATSFASPFPSRPEIRYIPSGYAHGGPNDKQGKVGGIIVVSVESLDAEKPMTTLIHGPDGDELEKDINEFARTISRQVVGFPTKVVEKLDRPFENDEILYEQPFMMFNGDSRSVKEVLAEWGKEKGIRIKVVGMRRWAVGDEVEDPSLEKSGESTA